MDLTARRLIAFSKDLLDAEQLDDILRRLLLAGRNLTEAGHAAVGVLDTDRGGMHRFLTSGFDDVAPSDPGVVEAFLAADGPIRLSGAPPMARLLGTSIVVRGQRLGCFYVADQDPGRSFTENDEEGIELLAQYAAVAIDHAMRFKAVDRRRRELERTVRALSVTTEIARALAGEIDPVAVLELIARRARTLVSARTVLILLSSGDELRVAEVAGQAPREVQALALRSDSPAYEVLRDGKPRRFTGRLDGASSRNGFRAFGSAPTSALFVPLRFRGHSLGVLVALDHEDGSPSYGPDDESLLTSFSTTAAAAVLTAQTVTAERMRERDLAAEEERRRWARELHDETLQGLALIRMNLMTAARNIDGPARDEVLACGDALQSEIDGLRAIIHDLRPSSLDDLGAVAALEALVSRHARADGPALSLEVDLAFEAGRSEARLSRDVETALYRITQEALTNAIKHASASSVRISIAEMGDEVGVRVRDDGVGFSPQGGRNGGGFGLIGMRERVEQLGGRLSVTSEEGRGTTVEARFPVSHGAAGRFIQIP